MSIEQITSPEDLISAAKNGSMLSASERRLALGYIKSKSIPLNGTQLSKLFNVSPRQIRSDRHVLRRSNAKKAVTFDFDSAKETVAAIKHLRDMLSTFDYSLTLLEQRIIGNSKTASKVEIETGVVYLIRPDDVEKGGRIGYIGQTTEPSKRKLTHLTGRDNATRELLSLIASKGCRPEFEQLKICNRSELRKFESSEYAHYKGLGWELWNTAPL